MAEKKVVKMRYGTRVTVDGATREFWGPDHFKQASVWLNAYTEGKPASKFHFFEPLSQPE